MQNKTTMTLQKDTKERLIALFNPTPKTQDEMLNRTIDELEELRQQNEILRDENERLKENGGDVNELNGIEKVKGGE